MKKYSMRSIPAAAAMAAVLIFGVQAQAQTTGNITPPGSTRSGDAAEPGPKGGAPKRAAADPSKPSVNQVSRSATQTAGTTSKEDNVSPEPKGGKAKSADERAATRMAKDEKNPARAAKRAKRKAPTDDTSITKPGG